MLERIELFLTALGAVDVVCTVADAVAAWLAGGGV